ncbi:hypothetical protein CPC08DRAFT_729537 [Agrocybe pediades]|nr:hypothetical protein CPC08DRAFT_729537 [Agrocybe pediades]
MSPQHGEVIARLPVGHGTPLPPHHQNNEPGFNKSQSLLVYSDFQSLMEGFFPSHSRTESATAKIVRKTTILYDPSGRNCGMRLTLGVPVRCMCGVLGAETKRYSRHRLVWSSLGMVDDSNESASSAIEDDGTDTVLGSDGDDRSMPSSMGGSYYLPRVGLNPSMMKKVDAWLDGTMRVCLAGGS